METLKNRTIFDAVAASLPSASEFDNFGVSERVFST
jgi:hypothetical protein